MASQVRVHRGARAAAQAGWQNQGGSGFDELLEPAVLGRAIRPPPEKPCRLPEPAAAIKRRVSDLHHGDRRDRAPGRHGGVLPSRLNRVLLRAGLRQDVCELGGQQVFCGSGDAEVVLGLPLSSVIRADRNCQVRSRFAIAART
jgi:hypothetical protein